MTLEEVSQSALKDSVLQAVTQAIQTDKWNDDASVAPFYNVHNELTVCLQGVVLRSHGIVMPQALRDRTCLACQSVAPPNLTTSLYKTEMPAKPWSSFHMDLCGPSPLGESVPVVLMHILGFKKWTF